ncbi:MAG: hypothetical protein ACRCYT_05460 [Cetobacterium sp.]
MNIISVYENKMLLSFKSVRELNKIKKVLELESIAYREVTREIELTKIARLEVSYKAYDTLKKFISTKI